MPCHHGGVAFFCYNAEHVPYSGKFLYGANFCIFHMKPRDTKIKTAKILTVEILMSTFEWAIKHVEAASK